MPCPNCYVNSAPEAVPVSNTNLTVQTSLGDAQVKWVDLVFSKAQSAGADGRTFLMADGAEEYEIADVKEVQVFINNVPQPQSVFAVSGDVTQVILGAAHAVADGDSVRIHALVRVA